jgi:alkanesulfonate monooxygenase SsuD/methylene tetrahydromethanopterin reductase-like flavin-dependent oxidoreductase (luciferase family)
MRVRYDGGFAQVAAEIGELERAGLQLVSVAEAYSFDAVSQLGYLAAVTERLELTSGILPVYTRTPTLTAMTAAGLDMVSGGRFTLGLGASGPQVVEGFHGVRYDAPLARQREVVEICRMVWRRERVVHDGEHYTLPLPPDRGTGLGRPLKLINSPVRERIPVTIAAIGREERRADRRDRRGLGADLLRPRAGGRDLGRRRSRPARRARPGAGPPRRPRRACLRDRGGPRRPARAVPRRHRALRRRHGRPRQELLQRAGRPLRLRRRRGHRAGPLPGRPQGRGRRGRARRAGGRHLAGRSPRVGRRAAGRAARRRASPRWSPRLVQPDRAGRLRTVEQLRELAQDL